MELKDWGQSWNWGLEGSHLQEEGTGILPGISVEEGLAELTAAPSCVC